MEIVTKYFAGLREAIGKESERLTVPDNATCGDIRMQITALHPQTEKMMRACVVARNRQFAEDTTPLAPGDEVVFIPPMAGGACDHSAESSASSL